MRLQVSSPYGIESQTHLGWETPLRSLSPTNTTSPVLSRVPKCHIHIFPMYLQGCQLHHPPGQPLPVPAHPLYEGILPDTQLEPPPRYSSSPFPCILTLRKETDTTSVFSNLLYCLATRPGTDSTLFYGCDFQENRTGVSFCLLLCEAFSFAGSVSGPAVLCLEQQ